MDALHGLQAERSVSSLWRLIRLESPPDSLNHHVHWELELEHVPDRLDQSGRSVRCCAAATAPDYATRHTTSGSYLSAEVRNLTNFFHRTSTKSWFSLYIPVCTAWGQSRNIKPLQHQIFRIYYTAQGFGLLMSSLCRVSTTNFRQL